MDIERRRFEASLGSERKPRLIEESELPPFLIPVSEIFFNACLSWESNTWFWIFKQYFQEEFEIEEEEVKEVELGRGNRMRKETNYDDRLSERDWLKAIGVIKTILHLNVIIERWIYRYFSTEKKAEEEEGDEDEEDISFAKRQPVSTGKRGRKKRLEQEDVEV